MKQGQTSLEEKEEYDSVLVQLGLDMFQYLCAIIASDTLSDKDIQFDLLINAIFSYFNNQNEWNNYKFAEFMFVLMVFNGGKSRLHG